MTMVSPSCTRTIVSVSRTLTIGTWSPRRDVAVPVRSVMLTA